MAEEGPAPAEARAISSATILPRTARPLRIWSGWRPAKLRRKAPALPPPWCEHSTFQENRMFQFSSEQFRVNVGLAEMLKGGVIMDVTNAQQAKIAEDAGASAVMALERVPSDIRRDGGVARMANIAIIEEIMKTVT